jgi:hypothetical protein
MAIGVPNWRAWPGDYFIVLFQWIIFVLRKNKCANATHSLGNNYAKCLICLIYMHTSCGSRRPEFRKRRIPDGPQGQDIFHPLPGKPMNDKLDPHGL